MAWGYSEAARAARYLERRWRVRLRAAMVLGSGLGDVVRRLRGGIKIPYESIPHFPSPTVAGHGGTLHLGYWGRVPVAVLEGRIHLYEGRSHAEIIFPTRVLGLAGVEFLLLTCAAGGIAPRAAPGSFMVFADHLNFQGTNPLVGAHDDRWGARFVDLSQAYDGELRAQARRAAARARLKCFEGVYAALLGPSYETPAEIRAWRRLGASAVGMSTVPEVIAARQMGLKVLAVATITNRAAGLTRQPLSHKEVLAIGKKASQNLIRLFDALLPELT